MEKKHGRESFFKKSVPLWAVVAIFLIFSGAAGVTYAISMTMREFTLLHGERIHVTGDVNVTDVEIFVGSDADAETNVKTSDNENDTPHEDLGTTGVIENHIVVRIKLSESAADTWGVDDRIKNQVRIYIDGTMKGTFTWTHKRGGSGVTAVQENVKLTVDTGDSIYPNTISIQVEPS